MSLSESREEPTCLPLILDIGLAKNGDHQPLLRPHKAMPYRVQNDCPQNEDVAIEIDGEAEIEDG